MPERVQPILKIVCLVLAALLLYQVARLATAKDPLKDAVITAAPALAEQPETPAPDASKSAPGPAPKKAEPPMPPEVQARIERIKDSEILAAVQRPLPMALLGIGGNDAIIRTASGQTGLLKEGEELGGVKLLRIGTNRVVVEHDGQEKELTIFSGFGSETLIQK